MKRTWQRRAHVAAGFAAFALIALFLASSLVAELLGGIQEIALAKQRIAWGLLLLIPALAIAGATGFAMAGGAPKGLAGVKARRMKIIAANGLLILAPAALFLAWRASALALDAIFWTVQALEYLAGTVNLTLIGLNFRDGLAMGQNRRRARQA